MLYAKFVPDDLDAHFSEGDEVRAALDVYTALSRDDTDVEEDSAL